jgi:membrane dipeptidase
MRLEDALTFHHDCLVLDGHTDVPIRLHEEPADLRAEVPGRHVDLPKLRRGGVDALVFALYVPPTLEPVSGWHLVERLYQLSLDQLTAGSWRAVRTVKELRQTVAEGQIAVLFALENGRPLTVPGALDACARLGVRYVTLTHGASHEWCDAATDTPQHGGLSQAGFEIVQQLGERGILVDVTHVSAAAAWQALAVSPLPLIASHSSSRACCDHPGNLSDDLVRAIAQSGGVVMVNSHPAMLDPAACRVDQARWPQMSAAVAELEPLAIADPTAYALGLERVFAAHPLPQVGLGRYVEHIVHWVQVAGEEHVGLGTDLDGIPETLHDFPDASGFPALTQALLTAGLDRRAIRLILGENFLRVLAIAETHTCAA